MVHTARSPRCARWGHILPAGLEIMESGSIGSTVPSGLIDLGFTIITSRFVQHNPHLEQIIFVHSFFEGLILSTPTRSKMNVCG